MAEIADLPEETGAEVQLAPDRGFFVDALVQAVRQQGRARIIRQVGMMRVFDKSQPIGLNDIYTNVNILEKISSRRRLDIAELLKASVSDEFERSGLGPIIQERVLGLEAVKQYSKLMLLGKPGAGKTTFLKYVAIQCISGNFQGNRVPVFITLKDFAETENATCLLE